MLEEEAVEIGGGAEGGHSSSPDKTCDEVAEMVLEPEESGLAGDPGDMGGASSCVPLMGVPSPSLFLSIDGRGDPGTVFSPASPPPG